MKHSFRITTILLVLFLVAQFIGLAVINQYIDTEKTAETGVTEFKELPFGERPIVDETTSYIWVFAAILIGTGLLLLIMKFSLNWLWKFWFFMVLSIALTTSFNAFMWETVAIALAFALAFWRVVRPNFWVQTGTELFVYAGLAAIFVPMFSILSGSILLILIAIYDAYAVWKSKHMIKLAKAQSKAKVFAGLLVPYKLPRWKKKTVGKKASKTKKKPVGKVRMAMLGGGDIGFPLIFAGIILKEMGLWQALVIPFFALAGLAILFWKAKEKKFYPAMPFIGAGCFLGLLVVWLIGMLL